MKCDKCENEATVFVCEINKKLHTKTQQNLCEICAKADGLPVPEGGTQKLFEEFVKQHSPKEPPHETGTERNN